MSFDYEKIKAKVESNDSWTSNSDLFMVLSVVFLLLYVVSSMRNGSNTVQRSIQYQELQKRNEQLESQIQAYETLKEDYLAKEASQKEQETYEALMEKLSLLKEETKEEKNELRRRALENEKKEMALNEYQQIIKNIIDSNMLAQQRIQKRDKTISKKSEVIKEQEITIAQKTDTILKQEQDIESKRLTIIEKQKIIETKQALLIKKQAQIKELEQDVEDKKMKIAANEAQIEKINKDLDEQIAKLADEYKRNKKSQKRLNAAIRSLKKKSSEKIAQLEQINLEVNKQLNVVNTSLNSAENQLKSAEQTIEQQNLQTQRLNQEIAQATQDLYDTKIAYDQQIDKLQDEHKRKMELEKQKFEDDLKKQKLSLEEQQKRLAAFQKEADKKEKELAGKIAKLNTKVKDVNTQLSAAENQKRKLAEDLAQATQEYKDKMAKMKSDFESQMARDKAAFEDSLNKQKLSAAARARKMAAFQKEAAEKERELQGRLAGLGEKISESEGKLAKAQDDLEAAKKESGRYLSSIKKLETDKSQLSDELKQAQSLIDTRKKLAKKMLANFKKKGVSADVDLQTGDVTISFGREYFDSGRADLKNGMKSSLQKFVPSYSESLFSDPAIASKIEAVEIIGFASPTYNGKFINPQSLDPSDKKAAEFNLKLSQNRANSVFNYMFDRKKLKYKHQQRLFPLVKVTGRSFMTEEIKDIDKYEGMSADDFCKEYDCKKAQRVIVKFSLKN